MRFTRCARWVGAAAALGITGCGGGGSADTWTDADAPFCNSWSRDDVSAFIPEPRLTEYQQGADRCVWESRSHITSGAATGVVELRVTVYAGTEMYDRLAAATDKITDTFDGPDGDVLQSNGVYMFLVDGNTYWVSATRGNDWDDAREQAARRVLLAAGNRYEP
ncbi:MAG TPA: hypothetical protein VNQ73_16730 [Ilumatobacter sp.]|nr:hypothetical protein [Ilumatobacter sp.]